MLGESQKLALQEIGNTSYFFELACQKICYEIELKSLILAQIERWRHALHMQVERQHGSLLLVASGERVSNASECTV